MLKKFAAGVALTVMSLSTHSLAGSLTCQGEDVDLNIFLPLTNSGAILEIEGEGIDLELPLTLDMGPDGIGGATGSGVLLYTEQAAHEIRGELILSDIQTRIVCELVES